jgi:hypothetical protein
LTNAKGAAVGRTQSQINLFVLEPSQPCQPTECDSNHNPNITPCGDGTWCYSDHACGAWASNSTMSCCKENFAGDKQIDSNVSCIPYKQTLESFNFRADSTKVYPSVAFCKINNPTPYSLVGSFSNPNITTLDNGVMCCPSYLDAVEVTTFITNNQTLAWCVPPISKDGTTTNSSASSTTSSSSSSATGKKSGAVRIPNISVLGAHSATLCAVALSAFAFL